MTNRFYSPFQQFFDSTPTPRSGCRLFFYAAGTSAKQNTYSNATLVTPNSNPLTLNALGQPDTDIFLSDLSYKVVLAPSGSDDPPNSPIWSADNFYVSPTTAKFSSGSGNPNGSVAGTAGSVGVPASVYWDYTNTTLYICTTTGIAASAVWTAVTAPAANPSGGDGTVAAPAYSFSSDTNTGIYRIGADNIGISLGGTKFVDLGTTSINIANDLTVNTNKFTVAASSGNTVVAGTFNVTGATTLSAALVYGGVTLSNAVTGTGNMVLSASPSFTGTTTIATLALTTVGAHTISGAITYGGVTLSNAVTGTGNMVLSASPTLTGALSGAAATFSSTVSATGTVTTGTGGTGTTPSYILLNGGSGAAGGSALQYQANSSTKWFVGLEPAISGSGTSTDYWIYGNAVAAVIKISSSTGAVTLPLSTASTTTTTGALVVTGGIGIGGAAFIGGQINGAAGLAISGATASLTNTASGTAVPTVTMTNTHFTAGDFVLNMTGGDSSAAADTTTAFIRFLASNAVSCGSITRNGAGTIAYNTSSDERGKPNRELLPADTARAIIDKLEVYDFDKDGNTIRGVGLLAQQAYSVHRSLASPGQTPKEWWQAEKAAPVPFLVANMQQINARLDHIEQKLTSMFSVEFFA